MSELVMVGMLALGMALLVALAVAVGTALSAGDRVRR